MYLSIVDHGPHHAFTQVERRQLLPADLPKPLPIPIRPLNILVEPRERSLALLLIQPIIIRIARIRKHPRLRLFLACLHHLPSGGPNPRRCIPSAHIALARRRCRRRAIQTRVARKNGAGFAQTAAGGQHLLDERREAWVFAAGAVQHRADQGDEQRACRDGQEVQQAAWPQQHGGRRILCACDLGVVVWAVLLVSYSPILLLPFSSTRTPPESRMRRMERRARRGREETALKSWKLEKKQKRKRNVRVAIVNVGSVRSESKVFARGGGSGTLKMWLRRLWRSSSFPS